MSKFALVLMGLMMFVGLNVRAHDGDDWIKACKAECPKAKTVQEVNACVEARENEPGFKNTDCYKEHVKHGHSHDTGHGHDDGHGH